MNLEGRVTVITTIVPMPDTDPEILSRIGDLVERERDLRDRHHEKPLSEEERALLEQLESELDQCWDLLNQRRALREFGMDPSNARVRDDDTVEGYQQ
jgi:Rad3-related DNA helicase